MVEGISVKREVRVCACVCVHARVCHTEACFGNNE